MASARVRARRVDWGDETWSHLVQLLGELSRVMARYDGGRVQEPRVLDWVGSGEATAYVLTRGDRPFGLVVLRVVTAGEPAPTLWIDALYRAPGEPRAGAWLYKLIDLERRRRGLRRVGGESPRPGMWRLAMRHGFRPRTVSFVKEG